MSFGPRGSDNRSNAINDDVYEDNADNEYGPRAENNQYMEN